MYPSDALDRATPVLMDINWTKRERETENGQEDDQQDGYHFSGN